MKKILVGIVISLKMQNTAVVEVTRRKTHPKYKRLLKRSKKYKTDIAGLNLNVGDKVKISEIRPMSKDKYFKVAEVIK